MKDQVAKRGQVTRRLIVPLSIGVALVAFVAGFGPIAGDFTPTATHAQVPLDDFKCYKVEGAELDITVTLQDQFDESPKTFRVEEPKFLCNPAAKNGIPVSNPIAHLVCYKIEEEEAEEEDEEDNNKERERSVSVTNQFGPQLLEVEKAKLLCVPSLKEELTGL